MAAKLAAEHLHAHVVVVDPPRKGLGEEVVTAIAQIAPDRVVYVSCDCATLARDIQRFQSAGYTLQKATAVDLFPRTEHVECAALLTHTDNPC